jgi:hypothetical protein
VTCYRFGVRLVLALIVVAASARTGEPCAPAPPPGATVDITGEQAVIVWDAAHHVEHFIRKAAFASDAKAFGFLVPTPAKPELGELPDSIFAALAQSIAPKLRYETRGITLGCMLAGSKSDRTMAVPDNSVQVLQTVRVAGFDATTLAADDATAIAGWLANHGFADTPALDEWLRGYVDAHWTITAFVVASGEAGRDIATRAVRMTFPTDVPFYPYREPSAMPSPPGRSLHVYFAADRRYGATLAKQAWSAKVIYAANLVLPQELRALAGDTAYVTAFDDSGPRHGTDELYFAQSAEPDVHPPDIVVAEPYEVSIEALVAAALIAIAVWAIIRRRRR